jgi:hypothetical protein
MPALLCCLHALAAMTDSKLSLRGDSDHQPENIKHLPAVFLMDRQNQYGENGSRDKSLRVSRRTKLEQYQNKLQSPQFPWRSTEKVCRFSFLMVIIPEYHRTAI